MDISKTQYNDSLQVRVTRQTGSSIERDNFSAMYLSNDDSLNPKFFLHFFSIKKRRKWHIDDWKMNDFQLNMEFFLCVKPFLFRVFLSFSKLSRQPYKISNKQAHRWILHWKIHRNHILLFIKKCTFYFIICDFSNKNLI